MSNSVTPEIAEQLIEDQGLNINIPNNYTSIGLKAFHRKNLASVTIPSTITSIERSAFSFNNLTNIDIPESVTFIGEHAFVSNKLQSIQIPTGLTSIGLGAFADNVITAVEIPKSVKTIDDAAFSENRLKSIAFPEGLQTIGWGVAQINNLISIDIPNSVRLIRPYAFAYNNLSSVTIPDGVTNIEWYAFYGNNLTNIEIPDSVKSIDAQAFQDNPIKRVSISADLDFDPTSFPSDAEIIKRGLPPAIASYTISKSADSIDEGESFTISLKGKNVATDSSHYYTIEGIEQADITDGNLTGVFKLDSNLEGSFTKTLTADKLTEGLETVEVFVYQEVERRTLAGKALIEINDTSTNAKTPTYSLSTSNSSIDEKSQPSVRFNISTTDVDANTRLYYTASGSDITASDFSSGDIKSSRLIGSDGNANFIISAAADATTEDSEIFNVKLYSDFQRTKLVATSSDVSITDTSKAKQSAALLSASVKAKTITLNFDSSLSNSKPNSQRFTVTADGKSIDISSFSLDADAGSLQLNLATSIKSKQTVKLAYTDLKGDQSTGVLQTTDGTDLASFSTDVSNNNSDSTAPIVTGATINGKVLSLSFDEVIAKATPSNRSWTLKEDGKTISITSASVDSSSAQLDLTLSTAVDRGSNITLSYSDISGDQKANVIQDLAGNDLESFSNLSVENISIRSIDPLNINTAEINGNEVVLAFNRELSSTSPSKGTFRLRANNKDIKVKSITLSPNDREAVLKIASPVAHGDSVTLSYTDAQGNQKSNVIEDIDGNDLASISNFTLINNTRKSATDFEVDYADADGKIINLYLTDSLSSSIPKAARFRVTADKRKQKISSVNTSQSDGIITLNLKESINPKQDILISYRDLKGNQLSGVAEDTDGNDLASFKNLSPINDTSTFKTLTDNNPPSLEDAYLDGTELVLEFDKILQTGKVSSSRFKLRAGKKRVRVASALVPQDDDSTAIVTLKKPLAASANSLSLTYKDLKGDQSSNIIQDDSGNDLASLRNFSVEII